MSNGSRTLSYLLAAAMAGTTLPACRTIHFPESKEDRDRCEIFMEHNLDNYGNQPASKFIPQVIRNLDELVEDKFKINKEAKNKEINYDFSKHQDVLGDDGLKTVKHLEELTALAARACKGADAPIIAHYTRLNGLTADVRRARGVEEKQELVKDFYDTLSAKHQTAYDNVLSDMTNFFVYIKNHSKANSTEPFNYFTKKDLREYAEKSGNAELIKATEDLIGKFEAYSRALMIRKSVIDALNVSEGRYKTSMSKNKEDESRLEKLLTGVDLLETGEDIVEECYGSASFKDKMKKIESHFKRDSAVDLDYIVRRHRWKIVEPMWDKYVAGKMSGKALLAGIAYTDCKIAEAAETDPEGRGIKFLKGLGGFALPGFNIYKAIENFSHAGAPDTAAGKFDADNAWLDTGKYIWLVNLGATNGDHVVGNKRAIMGAGWGHAGTAALKAYLIHLLLKPDPIPNPSSVPNPGQGPGGLGGSGIGPQTYLSPKHQKPFMNRELLAAKYHNHRRA
ncbi:hypothetical protein GOV06_04540 [Candidatus Woesearchaeota archaeon]|nr:hypothetical protein [Candidatus Woesearchaeota archaeon]